MVDSLRHYHQLDSARHNSGTVYNPTRCIEQLRLLDCKLVLHGTMLGTWHETVFMRSQ